MYPVCIPQVLHSVMVLQNHNPTTQNHPPPPGVSGPNFRRRQLRPLNYRKKRRLADWELGVGGVFLPG